MYCIDLIVPKGKEAELLPTLRKHLRKKLDLKAQLEKRSKSVYVLTVADEAKMLSLKRSTSPVAHISGSGDTFNGQGVKLRQVAEYLEEYGLVDLPVVDGTNNTARYNITFTFTPEKKRDLEKALANLGLKLTKSERKIDMLVFR
jgi:uncharacterized protein (TIGR03435 family)